MAKIFSILTLLVALGATFFGFQSKELVEKLQASAKAEHEDLLATRAKLKKTEEKLKATEDELAATKAKLAETEMQLAATKMELDKTKADLTTATTKLMDAETQLTAIKKQLADVLQGGNPDDLKKTIDDMKTKITDLEGKVQTLEKEKLELTTSVETLTAQRKENESTISQQRSHIKRYTDNIMQKGISGRVLAVNPGWGFCVLSIGDRQGAASNKIMVVARGGQAIGKVKIINVERTQSVADILSATFVRGTYVQPGDEVVFTGDDKVREEPPAAGNTPAPATTAPSSSIVPPLPQ